MPVRVTPSLRFTPALLSRGLAAALLLCLFAPALLAQSPDAPAFDPQTGEPVPFDFEAMPLHTPESQRGGGNLEPVQYLASGSSKSVRSLGTDTFVFQDGGYLAAATTADGGATLDRYLLPAQPSDMKVDGDLVYLPLRKSQGLMVLDASDPANLSLVGHLPGRDLLSIDVAGGFAYAGLGTSGIVVYDVSNPANITELGAQASAGSSNGTWVDGSTLYVAAGVAGLRIFDLTDPAEPAPLTGFGTSDVFCTYVLVRDDVAYLTGGFGLIAVDVSDPENPSEIGRFGTNSETTYEVALGEDRAYLPGLDGFRVLDISDLGAITQDAHVPASQALSVAFDGDATALFAERFKGVYALDVSDPASPDEIASVRTAGFAHKAFFDGDMLYVTDLAGGLRIIDTSGPEAVEVARVDDVPSNTQEVVVVDGLAYVTDADFGGTGFTIVDVSDPANAVVLGSYNDGNQAFGLDVAGTTAFVAFGFSGLVALDVSDPAEPTMIGGFPIGANVVDVEVREDVAYVVSFGGGMLTLDVSDPADMQQLDHEVGWGFLNAVDFGVDGFDGYTYVADGQLGLRVVDARDPSDLATLDTSPTLSQARDVAKTVEIDFDITIPRVYVADDFFGIREFTVTNDEGEATEIGSFESTDRGIGVALNGVINSPEGGFVALAAGETGVYLFEFPAVPVAGEDGVSPEAFALESAYPNPFATATTVRYTLPAAADVTLAVYDVLGRRVAMLAEGTQAAGTHEATFDAAGLPSGVYLARLTVGGRSETRKLLVVR